MARSNTTDPLANLRDIHLPAPVDSWPPAPGWWLLALLLLGTVLGIGFWLYRRHKRHAWRREALVILPSPDGKTSQDIDYFAELNRILKRAARVAYPQDGTDHLSGEPWRQFLARHAPGISEDELAALTRAPFQPEAAITPARAHDLTRQWIRRQPC